MPTFTRGIKRDQTKYVLVNPSLYYGFRTKDLSAVPGVTAGDLTALGHVDAPAGGLASCFGANAPKPPRVSKALASTGPEQQASISSFCAYDQLAAALGAGWNLAKDGRAVGLRNTARTVTAVIAIDTAGPYYCFPMNAADFASYATELGLLSSSSMTTAVEQELLVRGASYPKPGRAMKELESGATVNSFYSPEKLADLQNPTSGWIVKSTVRQLITPAAPTP